MLEVPRCEAWDFSVTYSRKESSCGYLSAERSLTRRSQVLGEFHLFIDFYFSHYSLLIIISLMQLCNCVQA